MRRAALIYTGSRPKSRSFPTTSHRFSTYTSLNFNTDTTDSSSPAPSRSMSREPMRRCTIIVYKDLDGANDSSLKWKPPSENSVDFRLELRFPPSAADPAEPDFFAKPEFLLYTWLGGQAYEHFDEMDVDDEEWERSVSHESGIGNGGLPRSRPLTFAESRSQVTSLMTG